MPLYRITNPSLGAVLGTYAGTDKAAALNAYARDADLRVEEIPEPAPALSTPAHTPGPWSASTDWLNGPPVILDGDGIHIAKVVGRSTTEDEDLANARRIVACVNALEGVDDPESAMRELRGALAAVVSWDAADKAQGFEGDTRYDDLDAAIARCRAALALLGSRS